MLRNFARINNYYNKIEAWQDWCELAEQAVAAGRADLVEKYQPPDDAGWRKIDKLKAKLRAELEQQPRNQPGQKEGK